MCSCSRFVCCLKWAKVQKFAFVDIGSFGAPTGPVLNYAEANMNTVTGKSGLGLLIASDIPSGKGRTGKPVPKAAPALADDSAPASAAVTEAAALPAAPSEFHAYADRGALRALLVADFQKLLGMGTRVDGRYAEPVNPRFANRTAARAVALLPAANSLWHHTKLLRDRETAAIAAPAEALLKTRGFSSASQF